MYEIITAEDAKKIMDSGEEYVLLDVREQDEFDAGHIPGAILIPYTEIENKAEEMLPDKDKQMQSILHLIVWCKDIPIKTRTADAKFSHRLFSI